VPPEEIYETCDRCKELFMPFMTFFDGKQFLCADCRSRASRRSART
jgi:formylmethanofuran dehydrogenase subunit E